MIATILMAADPVIAEATGSGIRGADVIEFIRNFVTVICLAGGLFFIMAGTIGVIRLPDFYTRLHSAGMTDTLGAELILFALIVQCDFPSDWQVIAKLLLVAFFLFVTSPTATHAVAHAAYRAGEKPLLGKWRAPNVEDEA